MKSIGGYFDLELNNFGTYYHDDAVKLNSGQSCFKYILLSLNVNKIYIPYYICDSLISILKNLGISYEFYRVSRTFIPLIENVDPNSHILIINYFGLLNNKINNLKIIFSSIILDNVHAFFLKYIDANIPVFYSTRKFFGVPDGGFVYCNPLLKISFKKDKSYNNFGHLLKRIDVNPEYGYNDFIKNELRIKKSGISLMSNITKRLLLNIDYNRVKEIRNNNFYYLHKLLKYSNEISDVIDSATIDGPLVYPYLIKNGKYLRNYLINSHIYVPKYWVNVFKNVSNNMWEYYLTDNLVPLPIDQRYNINHMMYIIESIKSAQII